MPNESWDERALDNWYKESDRRFEHHDRRLIDLEKYYDVLAALPHRVADVKEAVEAVDERCRKQDERLRAEMTTRFDRIDRAHAAPTPAQLSFLQIVGLLVGIAGSIGVPLAIALVAK